MDKKNISVESVIKTANPSKEEIRFSILSKFLHILLRFNTVQLLFQF